MNKAAKLFAIVSIVMSFTACSSIRKTATDVPVATIVASNSTADLQVSQQKISYQFNPSRSIRRGGEKT